MSGRFPGRRVTPGVGGFNDIVLAIDAEIEQLQKVKSLLTGTENGTIYVALELVQLSLRARTKTPKKPGQCVIPVGDDEHN
jgi:hypothetical protein